MFKNLIHCFSIEEDIKNFKENLIKECIDQRKKEDGGCNFKIQTKYIDILYKIFIDCAKKILKPFTIKDKNFKVWCYMTDSVYNNTGWHNHKKSATINSVIYFNPQPLMSELIVCALLTECATSILLYPHIFIWL